MRKRTDGKADAQEKPLRGGRGSDWRFIRSGTVPRTPRHSTVRITGGEMVPGGHSLRNPCQSKSGYANCDDSPSHFPREVLSFDIFRPSS